MKTTSPDTEQECLHALSQCRELFHAKLLDYGAAWRILRPESLTDQIYIKIERVRSIQMKGRAQIAEGIYEEFIGIVNYGLIGLIQLDRGVTNAPDLTVEEALAAYDYYAQQTIRLLLAKNHDYGEAWRQMRLSSIVDLILSKVLRTKQIEDNHGYTLVSEGIAANYMDMVNYALFSLVKLNPLPA